MSPEISVYIFSNLPTGATAKFSLQNPDREIQVANHPLKTATRKQQTDTQSDVLKCVLKDVLKNILKVS